MNKFLRKTHILILSILVLAISCSTPEKSVLPPGNISNEPNLQYVNTSENDVSPQALPTYNDFEYQCAAKMREHSKMNSGVSNANADVNPGSKFTKEILFPLRSTLNQEAYNYLAGNVESVFFVTNQSGFASFAYHPSLNYTKENQLPFDTTGKNGGVDIYEFNYDQIQKQYIFKNLGDKINSKFWDSNPIMISDTSDGNCYKVLLWSSDRNSPFRYIEPIDAKAIYNVNKDIFYSFKKNNEEWGEPAMLDGGNVNSTSNEVTPFIYCTCCNPVLFFASNRGYDTSNAYDLYYTKLKIDYSAQTIVVKQDAKLVDTVHKNKFGVINGINSREYDERFPYVPTTVEEVGSDNYLYFASNRYNKNSEDNPKYKDTSGKIINVIENNGGYDIYRFKLPANDDFNCVIPPDPVYNIYLKVSVNIHTLEPRKDTLQVPARPNSKKMKDTIIWVYDTTNVQENVPNYDYYIKSHPITSKDDKVDFATITNSTTNKTERIYQIEKSHQYEIKTSTNFGECETGDCSDAIITTPLNLYRNDTLYVVLNCYKAEKPPVYAQSQSYKSGIGFFVTGYWWPTTTKNLSELKRRLSNNQLDKSKFIDISDFKPDTRDLYLAAAETNDKFFNTELFPRIKSMLDSIDKCAKKQKIVITIHSFTDPCPLRTIRDEAGRVTQDYTLYTADPQVVINDVVIESGTKMKEYSIKYTDGTSYRSPMGAQQGNVVLAMLRAYYTKKTIIDEFDQYLNGQMSDWKEYVEFKADAFGIFEEATKDCPSRSSIYNVDNLPNSKYGANDGLPSEPCNSPYSRRTMIYVDLINNGYEKYVVRNECGEVTNNFPRNLDKDITKKNKNANESPKVELDENQAKVEVNMMEEQESNENLPCVGTPCYWVIQYGIADTKEKAEELQQILYQFGITQTAVAQTTNGWSIVSAKENSKKNLEQRLNDYKQTLEDKLRGLMSAFSIKAEIIATE